MVRISSILGRIKSNPDAVLFGVKSPRNAHPVVLKTQARKQKPPVTSRCDLRPFPPLAPFVRFPSKRTRRFVSPVNETACRHQSYGRFHSPPIPQHFPDLKTTPISL
jgi:hypothetical protein